MIYYAWPNDSSLKDGEMAFDAKDYLIEQERCEDVQLEQQTFCGKFAEKCHEEQKKKKMENKKSEKTVDKKRSKKKKKKTVAKDEL